MGEERMGEGEEREACDSLLSAFHITQAYLSAGDFRGIFGAHKREWYAMPKWRRNREKKGKGFW